MDNLDNGTRGGTLCLAKAGLAVGTTPTGLDIAAPNGAGVDFAINGIAYHKGDAASIAITAATAQATLTTCLYLVCLDSSGTLSTVKGTEVLTADLTAKTAVLRWPVPVVDTCPIGAFRVLTASTYTFTAGTTALDATGITDTYYDLFAVPASPLTA